jgi:hypothetical protein
MYVFSTQAQPDRDTRPLAVMTSWLPESVRRLALDAAGPNCRYRVTTVAPFRWRNRPLRGIGSPPDTTDPLKEAAALALPSA